MAHRGQQPDHFHGTILRLDDLDRLAREAESRPRFRDVAQMVDDEAVERLRAVEGKPGAELPVERA